MSVYVSASVPWLFAYLFGFGHWWLMAVDDVLVPGVVIYGVVRLVKYVSGPYG